MATFKNLNEMFEYMKKHPEDVMEQQIGEVIETECPACKRVTQIKIISPNEGECQECHNKVKIIANVYKNN